METRSFAPPPHDGFALSCPSYRSGAQKCTQRFATFLIGRDRKAIVSTVRFLTRCADSLAMIDPLAMPLDAFVTARPFIPILVGDRKSRHDEREERSDESVGALVERAREGDKEPSGTSGASNAGR